MKCVFYVFFNVAWVDAFSASLAQKFVDPANCFLNFGSSKSAFSCIRLNSEMCRRCISGEAMHGIVAIFPETPSRCSTLTHGHNGRPPRIFPILWRIASFFPAANVDNAVEQPRKQFPAQCLACRVSLLPPFQNATFATPDEPFWPPNQTKFLLEEPQP